MLILLGLFSLMEMYDKTSLIAALGRVYSIAYMVSVQ